MLRKLLLILLIILPFCANATHLLGGEITYKYEGRSGGLNLDSIYVNIYRDCNSATQFDDSIVVGIYKVSPTSQDLYTTITMYVAPAVKILPYADTNLVCTKVMPPCISRVIYRGLASLPDNVYGYKILFGRCCRTGNLVNVADTQGQAYTAFIPNTALKNSSPVFLNAPANFIRLNSINQVSNTALDVTDGDSLVYSLALPAKLGDASNPIVYPASTYIKPAAVIYRTGYNYTRAFGSGGSVSIDPVSGLTKILANKTGNYVLAIDVKEYRSGVLISTTRRDLVYIAVIAPTSPPIVKQKTSVFTTADSFNIQAGEKIIFRTEYMSDPYVYIKSSGELFDASRTNKPVVIDSSGKSYANSVFSWVPSCSDLRNRPYLVNVHVYNSFCPPTDSFFTKRIYVLPFKGASAISGPNPVCHGNVARYYIKGSKKGYSYIWSVVSGRILNYSLFQDSIQVDWGSNTNGSITLYQANSGGCPGDTLHLSVKVLPSPVTPAIIGRNFVCAYATDTYSVGKFTAGSVYTWKVKGGNLINTTLKNAIISWGVKDTGEVSLVETNASGCPGDTIRLTVLKNVPKADSIGGSVSVCPNARGVDYFIARNLDPSSTFTWKITGGVQASGGNTAHITVNWGNKGLGKVQAIESTKYGCKGDTINFILSKNYALVTSPIMGDTALCEFGTGRKYSVLYTHNSTYTWNVAGGAFSTNNGLPIQYVDWGKAGTGLLIVKQTAYDSVNNLPCISKDESLSVKLKPLPVTGKINGDTILCTGKPYTYSTSGLPGSSFIWSYTDAHPGIAGQGNDTIILTPQNAGAYTLSVRELTLDSCTGNPVFLKLTVNPSPATGEIQGNKIVCAPNFNGVPYTVTGNPNSSYAWKAVGGIVHTGNATNSVTVDWQKPGNDTLFVTETNVFGCSGGLKVLPVEFDSAEIDMIIAGTLRSDANKISLQWKVKNAQFLRGHLNVERTIAGSKITETIDTASKVALQYIDQKANPSGHDYDYSISGLNNCGERISSSPHRTILLKGTLNDSFININWNNYRGWDAIRHYVVFNTSDDDTSLVPLKYTSDSFYRFISPLNGVHQCYRVAAIKEEDSSLVSYSNRLCFDFEPVVYVPNIFTPDGNGLDDKFRVFASHWKAFDLHIYDRWGEEVFNSSNALNMWDGSFKGSACQEGVYLYILNVQGVHTTVRKQGTISLVR